jgi:hypothetical protein
VLIGKDMKGNNCGMIKGTILTIAWRDLGKPPETCQDSWCLGQDLNLKPPKYEVGMINTQPQCSVCFVLKKGITYTLSSMIALCNLLHFN